jgi:cytochrome-b5 reductase
VVQVYFAKVHPKFPDGGKMSQHMEAMKIGDTMLMQGPKGKLTYTGRGVFEIVPKPKVLEVRRAKKVGMIAGGTGITPMLQVIRAILKDSGDKTQMSLIFANQTEDDILLRAELEQIAADHPTQFKVGHRLSNPVTFVHIKCLETQNSSVLDWTSLRVLLSLHAD